MADYFEIDFLDVETKKSGDAIAIRYELNGSTWIHVVDGGYLDTGDAMVKHIRGFYGNPAFIDHVVATHPDGDHAAGLRKVLEEFEVGSLWMLRPWQYAQEILPRFQRFTSVEGLVARLKEVYPNLAALEEIALRRGIEIQEPFQGQEIGLFHVLAPTKARFLDCVVASERTPESVEEAQKGIGDAAMELLEKVAARVTHFAKAAWGIETFPPDDTSAENEMSVIQYANLCGKSILLTADAGRAGLIEAADFAPTVGLHLPGINRFQVPHHGSRRNVSTEILDRLLGPRLETKGQETTFTAIISAAKEDEDHPRKTVVRALIHRGARVVSTEGQGLRTNFNMVRPGWTAATPLTYPDEQEE